MDIETLTIGGDEETLAKARAKIEATWVGAHLPRPERIEASEAEARVFALIFAMPSKASIAGFSDKQMAALIKRDLVIQPATIYRGLAQNEWAVTIQVTRERWEQWGLPDVDPTPTPPPDAHEIELKAQVVALTKQLDDAKEALAAMELQKDNFERLAKYQTPRLVSLAEQLEAANAQAFEARKLAGSLTALNQRQSDMLKAATGQGAREYGYVRLPTQSGLTNTATVWEKLTQVAAAGWQIEFETLFPNGDYFARLSRPAAAMLPTTAAVSVVPKIQWINKHPVNIEETPLEIITPAA